MKVLVADLFSQAALDELLAAGIEVVYNHQLAGDSLKEALHALAPQVLVVRSTKVTADMLASAPALEFIIRAGAGVDTIDIAAASRSGVFVANCPGKNSIAVAELTMAHILSVDRRLPENYSLLKQGRWNKGAFAECTGIKGRTLGIIGLGAIGREVAVRAQSFGLSLVGTDPFVTAQEAHSFGVTFLPSALDVARASDIITFHIPATPETKGIINSAFISQCRESVVIVNTSRGELANDAELLHELSQRPGLWYACDVYHGEPAAKEADFVNALAQHPRVYGSHHIGASTKQAEAAIGAEALRMILQYARTRTVDQKNLVNLQNRSQARQTVVLKHHGAALAGLFAKLADCGCRVQEVENKAFKDGAAFIATVHLDCDNAECLRGIVEELGKTEGVVSANLIS
jgi:D-3-phosphoglycerate dehydrogenase / 2-oxoglutarate reductase